MAKIGVISTMRLKKIIRKIWEFEKFVKICKKFVKLKLDYKRLLLKQIKGTRKRVRITGKLKKRRVRKIGVQQYH